MEPIGIIIHEAAIHGNAIPLLSEFQAWDFGTIVNLIPKRHAAEMDMEKSQYLSPEPGVEIPFDIQQALITLIIHPPTPTELASNMVFHKLTAPTKWDPRAHNASSAPNDVIFGNTISG